MANGTLTAAQCEQFVHEGYLVVQDVLDPERDIAPVLTEYAQILDRLAADLYADGALSSLSSELAFGDRLIRVWQETGRGHAQRFDICLPSKGIRKDTPIHLGPAVFDVLTNERLLDAVESIVGPEIYSNPVEHIRLKLPQEVLSKTARATDNTGSVTGRTPWHQDTGVLLPEADRSRILTVWIPLNSATAENGCLQVVPGSHRGDIAPHCPSHGILAIPDRYVPISAAIPLPMDPGSILLMHQRTIHSSLENHTNSTVRISLDLRYQPTGLPIGRPSFERAGFVARSRANPTGELRDAQEWAQRWIAIRDQLASVEATPQNRWSGDHEACA